MSPPRSTTTSTDGERDRYAARRARMVERQLRERGIADERVLTAMGEVPRERFLPPDRRRDAYRDGAVAIGEGQTMSQPWIVACMTSLLELTGDERILEVGTGSGYSAAVLGRCCREVVTVERHRELAERAAATLAELGCSNVEVRVGDGIAGAPDRAPFGGISIAAAATAEPPRALFDQLARGRALVCPVRSGRGEDLMRFRDGVAEAVVPVRFVPLVADEPGEEAQG
jgi:protein-L-isoaspartate(D-aspartate) O-methyltransferase